MDIFVQKKGDSGTVANSIDTITDFVTGTDKIKAFDASSEGAFTPVDGAGMDNYEDALAAANARFGADTSLKACVVYNVGNVGEGEKVGYLFHDRTAAHRTHQSLNRPLVGSFHQSIRHTATSGETASAAVGLR